MSDNPDIKHSVPAKEKPANEKRDEDRDPKQHGGAPAEDFDQAGEGSTGTKLGSTDS